MFDLLDKIIMSLCIKYLVKISDWSGDEKDSVNALIWEKSEMDNVNFNESLTVEIFQSTGLKSWSIEWIFS
jgi:hypothetical protein